MEVHKSAPHSDLPEKAPEPDYSAYKYSIPETPPQPYTTVHAFPVDPVSSPPHSAEQYHQSSSNGRRNWTRWPLLLLYGLILAVIAGLVGGFVGKAIESNNHRASATAGTDAACATPTAAPLNPSGAPSASASASPTASPAASAAPTPSSSVFERVIPQPSSGCDASAPYRSFKSRSNMLGIPFTTICGQGWMRDDLVAMSVGTQSDCIESCSVLNSYAGSDGRKCVGAGFIPEWWNQTRAMKESGITPYNCFLKSSTSGIARNNEKFEVIALCMGDNCEDISG